MPTENSNIRHMYIYIYYVTYLYITCVFLLVYKFVTFAVGRMNMQPNRVFLLREFVFLNNGNVCTFLAFSSVKSVVFKSTGVLNHKKGWYTAARYTLSILYGPIVTVLKCVKNVVTKRNMCTIVLWTITMRNCFPPGSVMVGKTNCSFNNKIRQTK